jgi:hypothetical protein
MIDTEVERLRRLRNAALRVRAIAAVMESDPAQRNSVFARSALVLWQVARVITGRLRAHPYLSFQQGPSEARAVRDGIFAAVLGAMARYRGRTVRVYCDELRRVAREVDDARALTWSPDLSDDLGRSQARIHRLIRELEVASLVEAGTNVDHTVRLDTRAGAGPAPAEVAEGNWPYLAL